MDVRDRQVQRHSGAALDLPVVGIGSTELRNYARPLLSLKLSEFTTEDARRWRVGRRATDRYELFLHAFDGTEIEHRLMAAAAQVYCGNRELSHSSLAPRARHRRAVLSRERCSTRSAFSEPRCRCSPSGWPTRFACRSTGGCATCSRRPGRATPVYVSTALHENTSFDGSFVVRFEELQAIFNGQVYFMGYLSDTAVFNHLVDCTFLAAFFEKGLRANNTTVNAAMECGCAVITNLDEHSPAGLVT